MNEAEIKELANELEAYHTAPRHKITAAELRRLVAINAELIQELRGAEHTIASAQRGNVDQAWFIEALHSISSTLEKAKQ